MKKSIYVTGDEIQKYGFDLFVEKQLNVLMMAMESNIRFKTKVVEIKDAYLNKGGLLMTDYLLVAETKE